MKKSKMILGLVVFISTIGSVKSAQLIQWGNAGNELVDSTGTVIANNSGGIDWLIRLYESTTDSVIDFSAGLPGGDDVQRVETQFSAANFDGYFYNEFDPSGVSIAGGDEVYTVIFNASTFGAATMYCILEDGLTATTLPGSFDPPAAYDPTSSDGGNVAGDWVSIAVPEPSVLAFLGIGGVLVAVRRMRKV